MEKTPEMKAGERCWFAPHHDLSVLYSWVGGEPMKLSVIAQQDDGTWHAGWLMSANWETSPRGTWLYKPSMIFSPRGTQLESQPGLSQRSCP